MWPFDYFRKRKVRRLNEIVSVLVPTMRKEVWDLIDDLREVEDSLESIKKDAGNVSDIVHAHDSIERELRKTRSEYSVFTEKTQLIINHINNLEKRRGQDGVVDKLRGSVGDAFPGWSREDVEAFSDLHGASDEDIIRKVELEREERKYEDKSGD